MMLILFTVSHLSHPRPIELCGKFESLKAFERFKIDEAYRGWIVQTVQVLRES